MHGAGRIVVAKPRQALEYRAAVFGFGQVEAKQFADRRIGQCAGDDALEEAKPILGLEYLW